MRPRPPSLETRPPVQPEAIARFDDLSLAPRPTAQPLQEALACDPDLGARMQARETAHGRLATRAALVREALLRELERFEAAGRQGTLARARLHGQCAARLGRMARVHLGLPAMELELAGPIHELGACLAGVELESDQVTPSAHARLAAELAASWGLSGPMTEALAGHHGDSQAPGHALLALAEHLARAVEQRTPEQAENAAGLQWAHALGLSEAELARAVELTSSDWASSAA